MTEGGCLFRYNPHKIAHGFSFANRKCAAIFAPKPKCTRRSAIEIQCALYLQIISQSSCSENCSQFGERDFGANSKQRAIIRYSCGESSARHSGIIEAANQLVMIDEKWSTLNGSAYLFSSRKFANSQDLHTAYRRAQHAGDQSSALQWGDGSATAYQ